VNNSLGSPPILEDAVLTSPPRQVVLPGRQRGHVPEDRRQIQDVYPLRLVSFCHLVLRPGGSVEPGANEKSGQLRLESSRW
jgi:hypothetical protein